MRFILPVVTDRLEQAERIRTWNRINIHKFKDDDKAEILACRIEVFLHFSLLYGERITDVCLQFVIV